MCVSVIAAVAAGVLLFFMLRGSEPVTFTEKRTKVVIYRQNWGEVVSTDAEAVRRKIDEEIGRKLGIELEMRIIPGTEYGQKLEVDLSIGEQIDAFVAGENDLGYWYSRGVIIEPLNYLLQEHGQAVLDRIPAPVWDQVTIGDSILGVPSYGEAGGRCIVVRRDILDRYGLPVPRTIAELETVSARLLELDPDIIPITGAWWDFSYLLCPALGISRWDANVIDGQRGMIYSGNKDPEFYRYFATLRGWLDKGYLDRDFLSANFDRMKDLFLSGRNVFTFNHVERTHDWGRELAALDPEAEITVIPELDGAGVWSGSGPVPDVLIVTQYSRHKPQVIKYLNWFLGSREAYTLASLGIEGRHYRSAGPDGFIDDPGTSYRKVFAPIHNKDLARRCVNRFPAWYEANGLVNAVSWIMDPLKGSVYLDTSIEKRYPEVALFDQEWSKFLDGRIAPTGENYERILSLYFDNGGDEIAREYYRQYLEAGER